MKPVDWNLDDLESVVLQMTAGPWEYDDDDSIWGFGGVPVAYDVRGIADAKGIVALVNAAPLMIARIRELEGRLLSSHALILQMWISAEDWSGPAASSHYRSTIQAMIAKIGEKV